ncbi:MAG TPA: AsmA-like C-terminal region-containing protein [Burkholderiales bacterium]|nr:AsmA-like C-terminal region-containing protein [Burkholderiales bacterium]
MAGPLIADARLTDAGDLTRLDLAAKLGDITVKVGGTLRALGLPGSDLRIEASVADAARLATAFGVTGLPAGALEVDGRIASSRTEINLDGVSARFAGATARVSGTVRLAREPSTGLRFELAAESLSRLQQGLLEISLALSGDYAGSRDKLEVKNLKGRIGETEISGWTSMVGTGRKRVEIELASPRLDLTPFMPQGTGAKSTDGAHSKPKPQAKKAQPKFVFVDAPLPLVKPVPADVSLHFALAELRLGTEVLRDVDGTLRADGAGLTFVGRVRDSLEGTISGAVKLTPGDGGAAELGISVSVRNVRPSLPEIDPRDAPLTNVEASLKVRGASARQMASLANGRILVTQGPGKLKSGVIGLLGGALFRELVNKLNPLAAQDPYLQLECTVVRADIVDGQVTINPVLMQSDKVTIVAGGKIDLGTEALDFQFNTRPRTGVGVSAGMFTNPFVEVAGTLASPKLSVGAKAAISGVAAVATGGLSVLGQGLLDRARGSKDLCREVLDEVAGKASESPTSSR